LSTPGTSSSSSSISSSSSFWGQRLVTVRTTEYNSSGDVLSSDITGVFFGALAPGGESVVKIIGMEVDGATEIGNVKLGVTSVNMGGRDISQSLFYDVQDDIEFLNPVTPFPGVNTSDTSADPNNVQVGVVSAVKSRFVAVKIKSPALVNPCRVVFTWFFDYNLPLVGVADLSSDSSGGYASSQSSLSEDV
jgi:hypothetical protein